MLLLQVGSKVVELLSQENSSCQVRRVEESAWTGAAEVALLDVVIIHEAEMCFQGPILQESAMSDGEMAVSIRVAQRCRRGLASILQLSLLGGRSQDRYESGCRSSVLQVQSRDYDLF